ncbi:MAG: type-F conjugative transfer system secretin TraK [Rickettsiaceae bacterium]|nr:type-F conjugative transfer system secretin TraK [Rickettsiaceae bacterium]
MSKRLIFILLTIFSLTTNAAQYKDVNNMQTMTVDLSIKDPNIISVKNDRIKQYSSVKGAMAASIDTESGILNLKPTVMYYEKPFSMIIFTEKGQRYTLISSPKNIPAQDIVLTNNTILDQSKDLNATYTYEAELANLIKAMIKQQNIEGFKKDLLNHETNEENTTLESRYSGNKISGEVLVFKNNKDKPQKIMEEQFYSPKVLAVSLSNALLNPNDITKVYRVVSNE